VLTDAAPLYLFDVDNTLLDNDRFGAELGAYLGQAFGAAERDRYWSLYAVVRDETGYADYLETLQRFRVGLEDDARLLRAGEFMLEYPFADLVYPGALAVVAACAAGVAAPVIFSDGDIVFQPRKIVRSGLWDAFGGRVLVCVHKERSLDMLQRRYPARHYVIVDDKPRLLAAIKRALGARVTTIFVRQGHYAAASDGSPLEPAPDVTLARVGDMLEWLRASHAATDAGDRAGSCSSCMGAFT
jgi:FMN phosphatase YigB (HAD superfamily)